MISSIAQLSTPPKPASTLTTRAATLPRWPFALVFSGYPIAWVLGFGDYIFVVGAVIMVALMARARRRIEVPRWFGIWIAFLVLMLCSVVSIDSGGRLIGFVYRALLYLAVTVVMLYLYNARGGITPRYALGVLTTFWLVVVAGGFLGMLLPLLQFTTPLATVLPSGLLHNELVKEMVYRRTTQFDPTAWSAVSPRPSAPFLYTNSWGMAYSLLIPAVVGYLTLVRRERRFRWLLIALPISIVPALATLNRGMLVGLAVALIYGAIRLALARRARGLIAVAALGALVFVAFQALPTDQLLTQRLEVGNSTNVRADLYSETWTRTLESPILGFGAPRPSETPGAPSVGTQGQLWMVLFSHGIPATVLFVGWFVVAFLRSMHRRDDVGLAANTILLVFIVEIFFYGALASGLAIALVASTIALRSEPRGLIRTRTPILTTKEADS